MIKASDFNVVTLDACALVGALHRNILLTFAECELYTPVMSARILDETERGIVRILGEEAKARKNRLVIEEAFPGSIYTQQQGAHNVPTLPDKDDIHVLETAMASGSTIIVTENLKDFPEKALGKVGIRAISTDEFIASLIKANIWEAINAISTMRRRLYRPQIDPEKLLSMLRARGLNKTAALLEEHLDDI